MCGWKMIPAGVFRSAPMGHLSMCGRAVYALRLCAAFLCVSMLVGCATQAKVEEYIAPATACCRTLSELTFRPMPLGEELELSLTPASSTYTFSGKRQHVAALKIPDGFNATLVHARTYLSGVFIWNMSALLPEFVFLDGNQKLIDTRPAEGFQPADGFWRSGVTGRVVVPAGARYFIVKAGDGSRGVPVVHSDNGTPGRVSPAGIGDISLRIFGEPQK